MRVYIGRFGGLSLVLIAVVVEVLIGRVIEAAAVGFVAFAVWNSLGRLFSAPADRLPDRADGRG